jgi:hypothetical protein
MSANAVGERRGPPRPFSTQWVRQPHQLLDLSPFCRSLDFLTFLAPSDTLSITVEFHRFSTQGKMNAWAFHQVDELFRL